LHRPGSEDDTTGWIPWYCGLPGNEFLLEVPNSFINDNFNMAQIYDIIEFQYGVRYQFDIIAMIKTTRNPTLEDLNEKLFKELFKKAVEIFCIMHNRYIHSF
jgi:casein kinase II subunit beta